MDSVAARVKDRRSTEKASAQYWQKTKEDWSQAKEIWNSWGTMGARVKLRHATPGTVLMLERMVAASK